MTHKERVHESLRHKEPDRIPIDIWGSASRICNKLYFEIVKDQGWKGLGPKLKASRSGDYIDERVDLLIDSDFRHLDILSPSKKQATYADNGDPINEWGWSTHEKQGSSVITFSPLEHSTDTSAIEKHTWPKPNEVGLIDGLAEKAKSLFQSTDYFLAANRAVSGLMMDLGPYLRGFEQFMTDLYLNKPFAHHLINKIADTVIEIYSYYLAPIAPYIGWIEFSSDLGMQDRSLVSPEIFREFFKEPYRRVFEAAKKAVPGAKIWMHSCGSVRALIPDLIDIGLDILNSLQPRAKGMNSLELKSEFGRELIFHGGLDIQGAINGTAQEAIDETKRCIDSFSKGGGYIIAPSNHFMQDIPLENFYAIYATAREYGKY